MLVNSNGRPKITKLYVCLYSEFVRCFTKCTNKLELFAKFKFYFFTDIFITDENLFFDFLYSYTPTQFVVYIFFVL